MPVDVSIRGLIETRKNVEQAAADLHGAPMLQGMKKAALVVERGAKVYAPTDTGRLRASIASEVRVEGIGGKTVTGVVGSNVVYAAAQELGARAHFPPPGVLDAWARRHGMNALLVARAISRRGMKGKHFLDRAFRESKPVIIRILGESVGGIVQKANR